MLHSPMIEYYNDIIDVYQMFIDKFGDDIFFIRTYDNNTITYPVLRYHSQRGQHDEQGEYTLFNPSRADESSTNCILSADLAGYVHADFELRSLTLAQLKTLINICNSYTEFYTLALRVGIKN